MLKVQIQNNTNNPNPEYKTKGSSGLDLRANECVVLKPGERKLVKTGIKIAINDSEIEAVIRPRSGLALKHGLTVLNSPGTIDSDYRGEIGVILYNAGEKELKILIGDRIAQLVFQKVVKVEFDNVLVLDDTERGEGGFGSTGIRD